MNNNNGPVTKRLKVGNLNDVNSIIDLKIKSQNQDVNRLRNDLKTKLSAADHIKILEENRQFVPSDATKVC